MALTTLEICERPAPAALPVPDVPEGTPTRHAVVPAFSPVNSAGATRAQRSLWQRLSWRRSLRGRFTGRLMVIALVVICVRTFIGEASVVPTASMEGTVLVGDHLFMGKMLYGPEIPFTHWRLPALRAVHRGDIVVFKYPRNPAETFLKRAAAIGGDRVEIRDGVLYVNEQPVREPYAVHNGPMRTAHEMMPALVVPQGKMFVMGDNRDNSSDSRDWGFVPLDNVIGEPLFVYWSYDAPSSRWLDESPGHQIQFVGSIMENFFSKTRWKRTGTLL